MRVGFDFAQELFLTFLFEHSVAVFQAGADAAMRGRYLSVDTVA